MLKNKILVIFMLILLLLTFGITNCFASTTLINSLNVRNYYALVEEYFANKGWTIYDYIITSEESKAYIYIYPSETYRCYIEGSLIKTEACKIFAFEDASNPMSYKVVDGSNFVGYTSANCIIWSSFDINNEDGTLFFQRTPLSQGILAPIMGEAKPKMKEITMTLAGLLVLVSGFLVLVIGLRKALALLQRILKAS